MAAEPVSGTHIPTQAPAKKSTQFIAAPVDDDRLEPDAMRGSEFYLQNSGVEDLGAERAKKMKEAEKKSA